MHKTYNHNRPFADFENDVATIRNCGFDPVAVSQLYLENVFVFESPEDAQSAYHTLERDVHGNYIGMVVGWWYGMEKFREEVEKYEREYSCMVRIHWLRKNPAINE